MDKNTCPWLQKHLTLNGLKCSGSRLHLHYIITRWLGKKGIKNILQILFAAGRAGCCAFWCVGDRTDMFCTTSHGVHVVGPAMGDAAPTHNPVLLTTWSSAWLNPFMSLFLCLASWSTFASQYLSLSPICKCNSDIQSLVFSSFLGSFSQVLGWKSTW